MECWDASGSLIAAWPAPAIWRWLRQTGRRYIIGAPKSELKKFGSALAAADSWRTVHEGVEVKLARYSETEETAILCRSADRRSKEQAMHDKFSRRIEAALERLAVPAYQTGLRCGQDRRLRVYGRTVCAEHSVEPLKVNPAALQ